jgi:hypothetical protein
MAGSERQLCAKKRHSADLRKAPIATAAPMSASRGRIDFQKWAKSTEGHGFCRIRQRLRQLKL